MANTRPDLVIPANTWVDCYAASGIPVGTEVHIYNKGNSGCNLCVSPTMPWGSTIGAPLYVGTSGSYLHLKAGESGLWVYSQGSGTRLLIQEA